MKTMNFKHEVLNHENMSYYKNEVMSSAVKNHLYCDPQL